MGKPSAPATPTAAPKPIVMSKPTTPSSGGGGSSYSSSGAPKSFAGFQQFAQTGGFSPEDLANIRARAVSPVRAVYANAQQNVNRQRALQGGYSPGFNVLQARMAREQGQGISDAATNAEAGLAEMVQKGKLAGLQGMAGTEGRSGGSSGGGGGGADTEAVPMENALVPEPEKKKGFWGKLGSGLMKVGQIALPIAASAFTGGLAAPITAGLSGYGANIGKAIIGGGGKKVMADNLQNYMRMANIFSPKQQQQPQNVGQIDFGQGDIFAPQQPTGQVNFGQQDIFSPQQQPQQMEMSTIPSRQFPQLAPTALQAPREPKAPTAWDQFLESVMNPPKRNQMTYPDSTLNVYNEAIKLAGEPTAYDKNRVYVDGKAFQKQKAFIDPNTGEQRFLTDVKKPGFFDNTLKAMSAAGTAPTDILNQPYKDAEADWKLRTEGLKTVAAAEANQALAQQRMAQANIGIPGTTGARVMDAQTRARLAQLRDLPESEKLRLLQEGRVTIAELNAAAAMERTEAQQAGADRRVDVQQAGATTRTGMQQAGATTRTGMQQAGANQRMDQSQAGQDRRNAATIAGARERTELQQTGANTRSAARGRVGGISESQGKVAQQRVANELIDEMPELDGYITYDQNGFPLISDDLDPADRQFVLDEFTRRLGQAPSSVAGTTPKPPPAPPVRKAPPATIPSPNQAPPQAPTPGRGTPPPAAAKPATPASGTVAVIAPDGRTGTWDYSKGPIPNGFKVVGK